MIVRRETLAEQFDRETLEAMIDADADGFYDEPSGDELAAQEAERLIAEARAEALARATRRIRENLQRSDAPPDVSGVPTRVRLEVVRLHQESRRNICDIARELHLSTLRVTAILRAAGVELRMGPRARYGQAWERAVCPVCGAEFLGNVWKRRHGTDLYCSAACGNEARRRSALARGRKAGRVITCPCGRTRWAWDSALKRGLGRYCSLSCASRYGRQRKHTHSMTTEAAG